MQSQCGSNLAATYARSASAGKLAMPKACSKTIPRALGGEMLAWKKTCEDGGPQRTYAFLWIGLGVLMSCLKSVHMMELMRFHLHVVGTAIQSWKSAYLITHPAVKNRNRGRCYRSASLGSWRAYKSSTYCISTVTAGTNHERIFDTIPKCFAM
jgi:hypothetical protein